MTTARAPTQHWEDFAPGSVREFGAHTVTKDEILRFATEFDPQPFHVDEEAARGSLFGGLAVSSWHTCALVMRMMCEAYRLDSSSMGSPGLEQIKWLKPVKVGHTLRVRMSILEARPMSSKPCIGLVRSHWEALNQRDQVALSMEGWSMFGRRPGALS